MDSRALFTKTSPLKLFFFAAIPGSISMLASALYQLIDGVFVGQFLGETAFAAVNLAMPFVIINFSLADLIGMGSSVPISISLGKKQDKTANNIFTCSCLMIVGTGAVIGGILFAFAPSLIRLMGAQGDFADFAVEYLRVYAISSPFTTIVFAMDNYLRICGKVRMSMFLNIAMSVISAALAFLFLYVFKWGVWGSALATCIGMIVCVVIALVPFFKKSLQLRFCKPRFSTAMIKQIIASGSPNFLNNIAGRITSILMNILLVRFGGETAVSIYGVLMYIDGIIISMLYGMCDSLQPAIGYNWGAGKYSRVKSIGKCCFIASAVFSGVSLLVLYLFPSQIINLFINNSSKAFMQTALAALGLFSLTYITRWFSFASQSFMLAIEKPLPASIISVSTALIFPALFILILWRSGLTGLWLNSVLTAVMAAALSGAMLFKHRKELSKKDLADN